jgi:hypothetical protein
VIISPRTKMKTSKEMISCANMISCAARSQIFNHDNCSSSSIKQDDDNRRVKDRFSFRFRDGGAKERFLALPVWSLIDRSGVRGDIDGRSVT